MYRMPPPASLRFWDRRDEFGTSPMPIRIFLSDSAGDPVTGSAPFWPPKLPPRICRRCERYADNRGVRLRRAHIEFLQDSGVDVTTSFILNSINVADRPDEGPIMTFQKGSVVIPCPATPPLLLGSLAGLGLIGWRRRKSRLNTSPQAVSGGLRGRPFSFWPNGNSWLRMSVRSISSDVHRQV